MEDKDIINFWNWFAKNSESLHSDNYDINILNELDKIISNWGVTWEIGPGLSSEFSFTISPTGNKELLNKTKWEIKKAPDLNNWEFYSAKQAKANWYLAKLVDIDFVIDAFNWTYILLKYEDGKIEILLKADTLSSLDNEKGITKLKFLPAHITDEKYLNSK